MKNCLKYWILIINHWHCCCSYHQVCSMCDATAFKVIKWSCLQSSHLKCKVCRAGEGREAGADCCWSGDQSLSPTLLDWPWHWAQVIIIKTLVTTEEEVSQTNTQQMQEMIIESLHCWPWLVSAGVSAELADVSLDPDDLRHLDTCHNQTLTAENSSITQLSSSFLSVSHWKCFYSCCWRCDVVLSCAECSDDWGTDGTVTRCRLQRHPLLSLMTTAPSTVTTVAELRPGSCHQQILFDHSW